MKMRIRGRSGVEEPFFHDNALEYINKGEELVNEYKGRLPRYISSPLAIARATLFVQSRRV